jgi:hypothetical protein
MLSPNTAAGYENERISAKEGSSSFLKKRTKKLFILGFELPPVCAVSNSVPHE